jgi:glycosyltransferase involved in cell wall biosynthesis
MTRVTIVPRVLPHYRVPFFQKLADRLGRDGVGLKVVYGQEATGMVPRTVQIDAPWAFRVRNVYVSPGSQAPVWQPCLRHLGGSDLIIIELANRLLINYPLLAAHRLLRCKLAYWGHGRNLQAAGSHHVRERIKRRLVGAVDWWFAYTRLSEEAVVATGFPRKRVTLVQNSVDASDIEATARTIVATDLGALRARLGIRYDRVGIFCGGMYPEKKLDFLLAACAEIRLRVPDFHMVFIGDGPLQGLVEHAARRYPWIHYEGPKYGAARVPYFMISRAMLMPGMVGLAIIDSFATGTPMLTTSMPLHSPEIAYLENGVNGIMTPYRVKDYADAVSAALLCPSLLDPMRTACLESARKYDLSHMVENFAGGVFRCLTAVTNDRRRAASAGPRSGRRHQ